VVAYRPPRLGRKSFWRFRLRKKPELTHTVMKCETHNHPTAIAPFPGAATGAGGEIRDEGATGRGAKPKAGLVGYSVSHLRIPGHLQPWEEGGPGKPGRIASALEIMLDGPIGAAAFNNEFVRPSLCGYFRTFEFENRGYHKPIMLAGGIGAISAVQSKKAAVPAGALYVQLGGPGLLIGMGGGAALDGRRNQRRGSRLQFGAARQRRDPAPRRRSSTAAGSSAKRIRSSRSTTSAPAAVERAARARARRRPCARLRAVPCRDSGMSRAKSGATGAGG
jgi:phosphoribosylformylglycinamidine (FGAM) synthase-like enzyme